MKEKYEESASKPILFCGHASWKDSYGMIKIPKDSRLHLYAPLGAALAQAVVRALAAGERIEKGSLEFRRVSPITLFNLGYETKPCGAGAYEPKTLADYPLCLEPGSDVPNFLVCSPGEARIDYAGSSMHIVNIEETEGIFLSDLLESFSGKTCHFGGCSWVSSEFERRDMVTLASPVLAAKYKDPEISEEEKRKLRAIRFGLGSA